MKSDQTKKNKVLSDLNDQELLRYSKHILLPQIDIEGQMKLLHARVLIVGLGGLGSAAGFYLASSGVGCLMLADGDQVELSNLQRQILYTDDDIGKSKTDSACAKLKALNPDIALEKLGHLSGAALDKAVGEADLVVDACDNFETRYAVNKSCIAQRKNLVSGAAIRFEGQLAVFMLESPDSPCYECLYTRQGMGNDEACSENGILAPLVGMIGCMQAIAAIQILVGMPSKFASRLFLYDALRSEARHVYLSKSKDCLACNH